MNESAKIEELIETLKRQEKQLLAILRQSPKNEAQRAVWGQALLYLNRVGQYLDIFLPERKGN